MAFPNTVDSASLTPEAPGKNGPFRNGTDRYLINATAPDPDTNDQFLTAWKSTDDGATWTEQDAGNRPQLHSTIYSACQGTGVILVAFGNPNGVGYKVIAFDPGTDAWGTAGATTTPPINLELSAICAVYRTATDSLVLILPGNRVGDDLTHSIVSFAVFSVGAGTWSAWTDLDYEDYTNPVGTLTDWQQFPVGACVGSDGIIRVFMGQQTRLFNGSGIRSLFDSPDVFTVPQDCTSIDIECIGAGGGGGDIGPGGGGGGGGYSAGTGVAVTPGDMVPVTPGAGGAPGADGEPTSCLSVAAGGGQGGGQGSQENPGSGGTGDTSGGDGGTAVTGGGGGGACGNVTGSGGNGGDGNNPPFGGGHGGIPAGFPTGPGPFAFGGTGGNLNIPPIAGAPGNPPGAGAGGSGTGTDPGGGIGGDGQVIISYVPNRGSQPGRLWQQAILADNSLGTLEELEFGLPIQNPETQDLPPIPVSFDCAAGNGFVAFAATGVSPIGYASLCIAQGSNADPVAFTADTFDVGNSGSGQDSSPALAIDQSTDDIYCVYKAVPFPPVAAFAYLINGGSPVALGSFSAAGARITAAVFSGSLQIALGTPTQSGNTIQNGS